MNFVRNTVTNINCYDADFSDYQMDMEETINHFSLFNIGDNHQASFFPGVC
jgi:hypothetical protein